MKVARVTRKNGESCLFGPFDEKQDADRIEEIKNAEQVVSVELLSMSEAGFTDEESGVLTDIAEVNRMARQLGSKIVKLQKRVLGQPQDVVDAVAYLASRSACNNDPELLGKLIDACYVHYRNIEI